MKKTTYPKLRKLIFLLMTVALISCLSAVSISAATDEPVITLEVQSPNYPEYSVAIYTVKAEGKNLSATWYMDWQGKTYEISKIGGAMQPWEGFAGESYGAKKLDDNTFAYVFEGIEYDLDGAYIWCVIEDGHYSVTSKKNRISVTGFATPPEILSIPTMLTVEQGDEAEIRCVAKAPDGKQLSYVWYETDTGKREDIRAVNRGTETTDCLICDTKTLGTRNYVCKVETSDGGLIYSSLVPVTVIEKQAVENGPQDTPNDGNTEQTDSETEKEQDKTEKQEFPWLTVIIVAVAAIGVGFGAAFIVLKKKS